jgi:hypothetical protein
MSDKTKSEAIATKNNTKPNKKIEEDDTVFQTPPTVSPMVEMLKKEEIESLEELEKIELTREEIFVNLTLIAKIEAGDKLIRNKSDKFLNIDTSYFQFITRWFNGVNRTNILAFINLVLRKAFQLNDNIIKEKNHTDALLLFRLTSDLKNCLNGLNNLKQTYSFDKLVQAEIDVMIDNIRSKLDINSKNLNFTIHS